MPLYKSLGLYVLRWSRQTTRLRQEKIEMGRRILQSIFERYKNKINEQHRDALKASLEVTMALIEHVEDGVL